MFTDVVEDKVVSNAAKQHSRKRSQDTGGKELLDNCEEILYKPYRQPIIW